MEGVWRRIRQREVEVRVVDVVVVILAVDEVGRLQLVITLDIEGQVKQASYAVGLLA